MTKKPQDNREAVHRVALITPGEWVVDDPNDYLVAVLVDGIYEYVCDCANLPVDRPNEESAANAILISAAPNMRTALEAAPHRVAGEDDSAFFLRYADWLLNYAQPALVKAGSRPQASRPTTR